MDHLFLETYWSTPCKGWFDNGFNKSYIRKAMKKISNCEAFSQDLKIPKPGNYDAIIDSNNFFSFAMDLIEGRAERNYLEAVRPYVIDNPRRKRTTRSSINIVYRRLFYDIWLKNK